MKISEAKYSALPEKQKVFFEPDGNGSFVLLEDNSEEFLDLAGGEKLAKALNASRKDTQALKAQLDELAKQNKGLQDKLGDTVAPEKSAVENNSDNLLLSKKQQQQIEEMQAKLNAAEAERAAEKQALQAREQALKLQEKVAAEFGKLPLVEGAKQLLTAQALNTFLIDAEGDVIAKDGNGLGVSVGTSLATWAQTIPETHAYAIDKTTHGGGGRAGITQKTQTQITPDAIKTAITSGSMRPTDLAAQVAASGNGDVLRQAIINGGKLV